MTAISSVGTSSMLTIYSKVCYAYDMEIVERTTYVYLSIIVILIASLIGLYRSDQSKQAQIIATLQSKAGQTYIANIPAQLAANSDFRKVLFTGTRSQLVLMSIPPGGEVGEEVHKYVEQTLFFASGTGKAILEGNESPIGPGDVVVVTPGTKHNFVNTGVTPLAIYTVYAPANHLPGTTEVTKADADRNIADETFGESYR